MSSWSGYCATVLALTSFAFGVTPVHACDECSTIAAFDEDLKNCFMEQFDQIDASLGNREPDNVALDLLCNDKSVGEFPSMSDLPDIIESGNGGLIMTPRLVLDRQLARCIRDILHKTDPDGLPINIVLSDAC